MEGQLFFVLRYKNEKNIKVDFEYIKFIGLLGWQTINQQKKDRYNPKLRTPLILNI